MLKVRAPSLYPPAAAADVSWRRESAASDPSSTAGLDRTFVVRTVLTTAFVAVALCGAVWGYASATRPDSNDRMVLCGLLVLPAVGLVVSRSTLLLDHFLIVVVVNRLLRRLLDWGEGRYDALPLLSLVPMVIAFLMVLDIYQNWQRLPSAMRRAGIALVGAMVYGLVFGLPVYGLQSLYASAEYVTPLIVLYYCASLRPSRRTLVRWATVLGTLGVLAAIYGIVQWTDVPPWDATWLIWSGMTGSQGSAMAYRMSIMSTLESRGPAAMFFSVCTAMFVGLPFLRRRGGIVLGVLPAIAMLLTTARTGLVYLVLTLMAAAILSRGRAGFRMMAALLVIATGAAVILGGHSESGMIFDRVATLGDVQNDNSATGRVDIAERGLMSVLAAPQGYGFGSGGNATKVTNSRDADTVGDNGYLEILSTLGVPGGALYAYGLILILRHAFKDRTSPTGSEPSTRLALGMAMALLPALVIGNCLITAHASYLWILLSRHLAAPRVGPPIRHRAAPSVAEDA